MTDSRITPGTQPVGATVATPRTSTATQTAAPTAAPSPPGLGIDALRTAVGAVGLEALPGDLSAPPLEVLGDLFNPAQLFQDAVGGISSIVQGLAQPAQDAVNRFTTPVKSRMTANPADANAPAIGNELPLADPAAVARARAALSPEQARQLATVEAAVAQVANGPVADPTDPDKAADESAQNAHMAQDARNSLDRLLASGELGQADLKGTGTLLSHLAAIATGPNAPGIDASALTAQVAREVDNPSSIAQKAMNTCGPTTAQIITARNNAADYARLVQGLASPAGTVQTAGGDTLTRDPHWSFNGDGNRTISSRLLQPAFMDLADRAGWQQGADMAGMLQMCLGPLAMLPNVGAFLQGPLGNARYSNSANDGLPVDLPVLGKLTIPGLPPNAQQSLLSTLSGKPYQWQPAGDAWQNASPDHEVAVILNYATYKTDSHGKPILDKNGKPETDPFGPHWLTVVGRDPHGDVKLINPWGQEETMNEQSFRDHLVATVSPAS